MIRDGKNYFCCEDEFLIFVLRFVHKHQLNNLIDFFFSDSNDEYGESNLFIEEKAFKRLLDCKKILSKMNHKKIIKFLDSNQTELKYAVNDRLISNSDLGKFGIVVRAMLKLYSIPDTLFESYINEYYLLNL